MSQRLEKCPICHSVAEIVQNDNQWVLIKCKNPNCPEHMAVFTQNLEKCEIAWNQLCYRRLHNDQWVSVKNGTPERDHCAFYKDRYSVPVLGYNASSKVNKHLIKLITWDYLNHGWTDATLLNGPNPSDYPELKNVTHWHYIPKKIR